MDESKLITLIVSHESSACTWSHIVLVVVVLFRYFIVKKATVHINFVSLIPIHLIGNSLMKQKPNINTSMQNP